MGQKVSMKHGESNNAILLTGDKSQSSFASGKNVFTISI